MENAQLGIPSFPILISKAYNARCILAWLSAFGPTIIFFNCLKFPDPLKDFWFLFHSFKGPIA